MDARRKSLFVAAAVVVMALLLACLAHRKHRPGDVVLQMAGETVQRQPVSITSEEMEIAKAGDQAYGHRMAIEPPDEWYLVRGSPCVRVTLQAVEGEAFALPGNWVPEIRGALGLPPEMTFVEATRDGVPVPCDRRPPSPEVYGGCGTGAGYPLDLCEYGDFSQPGHYVVRIIAKCPLYTGQGRTALLASNQVEFDVPESAKDDEVR